MLGERWSGVDRGRLGPGGGGLVLPGAEVRAFGGAGSARAVATCFAASGDGAASEVGVARRDRLCRRKPQRWGCRGRDDASGLGGPSIAMDARSR